MAGQPSPYTARARGVVVARIGCLVASGAMGDPPPFHNNLYVVTHRPHAPIAKQGDTTCNVLDCTNDRRLSLHPG